MEIPAKVTRIKYKAFYNNSASTIPSFIKNLTFAENSNCSSIDHSAFRSCSSLVSADISKANNLTEINQSVFMECSSLTSIDFSSTVTFVDSDVFNNCPNLNSITWDRWTGSINFISSDAFRGVCPTGGTVTVTNPICHDSDKLLKFLLDYGGLPSAWAKDVVTPLPEEVYKFSEDCKTLLGFQDEFLNDPASDIYKDKFNDCNSMVIPATVTSIGDKVFGYFAPDDLTHWISNIPSFITKLTFAKGSNCSTIGMYNFANCQNLTSVTLPDSLTTVNNFAFSWCYSLHCKTFPDNLQSIGAYAFDNCPLSTSLDLSKCINLSLIDTYAFAGSEFHSIAFPGSLQSIGDSAFRFCSSLEEIIWNNLNSAPTIDFDSFNDIPDTGHVKSTGSYTSSQLLSLLKQDGGLPSGWTVAED